MATSYASAPTGPTPNYRHILTEAGKAIGISLAINIVLYFILAAAGLIDAAVVVTPDGKGIDSPVPVVMATVMGLVVGTLIFLALVRFTRRPAQIFTWIAGLYFLISLAQPFFAIKDVPAGMALALDLLHVAPAYLIWRFLTRSVTQTAS